MGMRRKRINKEVRKDIIAYWSEDKKAALTKGIKGKISYHYELFEKQEEDKIQEWAHKMVPKVDMATHADRQDIKRSIRKFMRRETLLHLGLSKYFPELYTEEQTEESNEKGTS